jgi:hypothetical protein
MPLSVLVVGQEMEVRNAHRNDGMHDGGVPKTSEDLLAECALVAV